MRLILGFILIFPVLAFAGNKSRSTLEQDLLRSFRETKQVISIQLQKMTDPEIKRSTQLIENVRAIALGKTYVEDDEPKEEVKTCKDEKKEVYEATITKLRNFASAQTGLNRTVNDAIVFAKEWTNTYICDLSDKFIKDHTRIKNFAAAKAGLDFPMPEAIAYANRKIAKLCDNIDFETDYKNLYKYATSQVGLKMSPNDARNYVRPFIERDAFDCENF